MKHISRIEATEVLGVDISRWRNYEIEMYLNDQRGPDMYVIAEFCPFNGVYCEWVDHCPPEILEQIARDNPGRGVARYCEVKLMGRRDKGTGRTS